MPILDQAQIEMARMFAAGEEHRFAPAEAIYRAGDKNVTAWLVLEGEIELSRHDGLGRDAPISTLASGRFTGEVGQLSGRTALAGAQAGSDGCVALPFDAAHFRALVIGSAEIGEIVMRALILRRVALIEDGGSGTVLIGKCSGTSVQIDVYSRSFLLTRRGPCAVGITVARAEEGR